MNPMIPAIVALTAKVDFLLMVQALQALAIIGLGIAVVRSKKVSDKRMAFNLRTYQQNAVDAVARYWQCGGNHGLVVIPTGGGKSAVMAAVIKQLRAGHPGTKFLVTAHRATLVKQNFNTFRTVAPDIPAGIVCAELKENCLSKRALKAAPVPPVIFASKGSITNAAKLRAMGVRHVLIVDEAQLISHREDTGYRKLIKALQSGDNDLRVLGATATPYRLSTGRLDENYGNHKALFDGVIYEKPIGELVADGWLTEPLPPQYAYKLAAIDVAGVGMRNRDFDARQLEAASNKRRINELAVHQIATHGSGRKHWLVFASGVDHAHALSMLICGHRDCAVVTGDADTTGYWTTALGGPQFIKALRADILDDFNSGALGALVNINVLTEGFDSPSIDLVAVLRPTMSAGLWYQMIGRVMRVVWPAGFDPDKATAEERREAIRLGPKPNGLLLDFARNAGRLGPLDQLHGSKEHGASTGQAITKECPECHERVHASYRKCPYCAFGFPEASTKLEAIPSADAILSGQVGEANSFWRHVTKVRYRAHKRRFVKNAKPTLAIDYHCGLTETYTRYLSFDAPYESQAASLSRQWWRMVTGGEEPPESVAEGLERCAAGALREPGRIMLVRNGKYFNVRNEDYTV